MLEGDDCGDEAPALPDEEAGEVLAGVEGEDVCCLSSLHPPSTSAVRMMLQSTPALVMCKRSLVVIRMRHKSFVMRARLAAGSSWILACPVARKAQILPLMWRVVLPVWHAMHASLSLSPLEYDGVN